MLAGSDFLTYTPMHYFLNEKINYSKLFLFLFLVRSFTPLSFPFITEEMIVDVGNGILYSQMSLYFVIYLTYHFLLGLSVPLRS